jgi:hypothetical protein
MASPDLITDPLPAQRSGGPCDWPFDLGCCQDLDLETVPDAIVTLSKTWVAEILWAATGRRFGLCEKLVRPCNRGCISMPEPSPTLVQGTWFNSCGCNNPNSCSCGPVCELCLPGPVYDVCEILIDGEVIDPATYRVDDHRYLLRTGGEECWPRCQHLDAGINEPGSFAVRYRRGVPVPEGGAYAAGQYLCEVIKQCIGDKSCRLPRNITQINRAGVQVSFSAGSGKFAGLTGIPEVDMWVGLVNPAGLTSPSQVWSPDTCAKVRTTTAPRPWAVGSCNPSAIVRPAP